MNERGVEIRGLVAALPTPVRADGRVDLDALDRVVALVAASGADGVCVAGATGEYPHVDDRDRGTVVRRVADRLPAGRLVLAGAGAASPRASRTIGADAMAAGAHALLLPPPLFFRYEPEDLEAWYLETTDVVQAPVLLYSLPMFTNPLTTASMVRLMSDALFVIGLKDSSGDVARLRALADERGTRAWTMLVGDDRLIAAGLAAGWNGAVSGLAACCPELLVALVRAARAGDAAETSRRQAQVDELAAKVGPFPTPWGIRLVLDARGIPTGPLPMPLTARRQRQAAELKAWVPGFLDRLDLALGG